MLALTLSWPPHHINCINRIARRGRQQPNGPAQQVVQHGLQSVRLQDWHDTVKALGVRPPILKQKSSGVADNKCGHGTCKAIHVNQALLTPTFAIAVQCFHSAIFGGASAATSSTRVGLVHHKCVHTLMCLERWWWAA